jgi:hypothetical protein
MTVKSNLLALATYTVLIFFTTVSNAQDMNRQGGFDGGGGGIADDFLSHAKFLLNDIPTDSSERGFEEYRRVREMLNSPDLKVRPTRDQLQDKNGSTQTALNFPSQKLIKLNIKGWDGLSARSKGRLAIHELVGLINDPLMDDSRFTVTDEIINYVWKTSRYTAETRMSVIPRGSTVMIKKQITFQEPSKKVELWTKKSTKYETDRCSLEFSNQKSVNDVIPAGTELVVELSSYTGGGSSRDSFIKFESNKFGITRLICSNYTDDVRVNIIVKLRQLHEWLSHALEVSILPAVEPLDGERPNLNTAMERIPEGSKLVITKSIKLPSNLTFSLYADRPVVNGEHANLITTAEGDLIHRARYCGVKYRGDKDLPSQVRVRANTTFEIKSVKQKYRKLDSFRTIEVWKSETEIFFADNEPIESLKCDDWDTAYERTFTYKKFLEIFAGSGEIILPEVTFLK